MSMVKTVAETKTGKKWWEQKAAPAAKEKEVAHTKSLQTITFNTSSFNDEERTFVAIASTPVVDRYGDTIDQEGWDLENFLKNPVIPWAHDYWQPPVGRVVEIGINEQGNLQFKYQAPPKGIYPFADTIWELYRNQFMFAFSVGFSSMDSEGSWETGYQFNTCELLEISAVVVPANPQAVALALDKGIIDHEQLKGLKSQLADGIKNVDRLIEKQATDTKADEKKTETKDATDAGTVTVDVNLNSDQVKELVEAVNKAAERLEAATKAANEATEDGDADTGANGENEAEKAADEDSDAKSLTTAATIDDTKAMETKAGASLSKANKDKLKAMHSSFEQIKAMCDDHMLVLKELLGDETDGAGAEKAAEAQVTKAADGEEAQAGGQAEGQEQKADQAETAEGTNNDEQQAGDDNAEGKGDGEVNSEAVKADEGADQKDAGTTTTTTEEADKADEGEEMVDPNDLTPEQAEKIAAAVNDELEKLKQ